MAFRWMIVTGLLILFVAAFAHAQTTDYHIRFGMKPSKSTPPEVIDMSWARQYMDDNATDGSNATRRNK